MPPRAFPSVQDADGSRDGFRNDSGVESSSPKVHGRLPDRCNPTSAVSCCPAAAHFRTKQLTPRGPLHAFATGSSQFHPKAADLRGTHSTGWWVGWGEGGGVLCVYPRSPLLCSTLAGGCECLCSRVCVWDSVAVLVASQDVEVAVSRRVVCRPALQHHHPEQNETQQTPFRVTLNSGTKKNPQNKTHLIWPLTPVWREHCCSRRKTKIKTRGSFHTNSTHAQTFCGPYKEVFTHKLNTNWIISADTHFRNR